MRALVLAAILCCIGCDDGGMGPTDAAPPVDAGTLVNDGSQMIVTTDSAVSGGAVSDGAIVAQDGGVPPSDSGPAAETGTIQGNVTRTARPRAGGIGALFIAVFDRDPVFDPDNVVVVGGDQINDADMNPSDVSIPYRIEAVPVRAETYFITAFLDDDGTVDTSDPDTLGPDRGDLISTMGLATPRVGVTEPGVVTKDIVLNINLPF